jgi:hypothetical protein
VDIPARNAGAENAVSNKVNLGAHRRKAIRKS